MAGKPVVVLATSKPAGRQEPPAHGQSQSFVLCPGQIGPTVADAPAVSATDCAKYMMRLPLGGPQQQKLLPTGCDDAWDTELEQSRKPPAADRRS